MPRRTKQYKMPADLHAQAVAMEAEVVKRFGPPPGYRAGGPAAALTAGLSVLEAVLSGKQELVPAPHMRKYEAVFQASQAVETKSAMHSTMLLAACMKIAHLEGAEDPEKSAHGIAAALIRLFVETEVLEAEATASGRRPKRSARSRLTC